MRNLLQRSLPTLFGLMFVWAGIYKLLYPGAATMALEVIGVPNGWARGLVGSVTAAELYLGAILLVGRNRRYALNLATGVMLAFTLYLFYLTTLAHPPSCGCLGLTGIFENSRFEALLGLIRNCIILWGLKWTSDYYFPQLRADESVQVRGSDQPN